MGRGKIEIKKTEKTNGSMPQILERYTKCLEPSNKSTVVHLPEPTQERKEEDILKEEIEKLELKQSQMMGKNLSGLRLEELQELEQQLNEGLSLIKERKETMVIEQLKHARMQEQRALQEKQTVCLKIAEFQHILPSTELPASNQIEYYTVEKESMPANDITARPDKSLVSVDNEDSDTNLRLGLPSGTCEKRIGSEAAECSSGGAQKRKRICCSTVESQKNL